MRYLILGATGKTGTQLLDLALQSGHGVTAFVRSPHKLSQTRAGLSVVQGSPANVSALAEAMAGHDVVFSALAPGMREILGNPAKRTWTMAGYASNITEAMAKAGVKRLVAFSSAGLFPGQGLFVRMLSYPARHHMADLKAMEAAYQASHVEWTVLRPTWLAAGPSEAYRVAVGALPERPKKLHFRGLAKALLDAATNGSHRRAFLGVGR